MLDKPTLERRDASRDFVLEAVIEALLQVVFVCPAKILHRSAERAGPAGIGPGLHMCRAEKGSGSEVGKRERMGGWAHLSAVTGGFCGWVRAGRRVKAQPARGARGKASGRRAVSDVAWIRTSVRSLWSGQ